MGYIPVMPRGRQYQENNSRYRSARSGRGRAAKFSPSPVTYVRAPWVAVRALLVSMGYRVVRAMYSQSGNWTNKRGPEWAAVTVERDGVFKTRWVRQLPGMPIQVSDGSEVPREVVMRYAVRKRIGMNLIKERAEQWRKANTQKR